MPAELRKLKRAKRIYVMADDSKLGIQEGKRGRGAPKRVRDESKEHKALRKALGREKVQAVQAAKRGKPGPLAPDKVPKVEDDSGFRNVRALLIFRASDLAGLSKGRHEILKRRVIAHIGTLEEWYKFVHMAFCEEGVYTAEEVVAIADGGTGIGEMFSELLPPSRHRKVIQVLDYYHATSHLWTAARALKGTETAAQRKASIGWAKPLLADLRAGRVSNVIQRLGKLKCKGKAAEEVAKVKLYFETHRQRMRYPKFPIDISRGPRFGMQIKEQGAFLPVAYSRTSLGEMRRSDAELRPKRGIAATPGCANRACSSAQAPWRASTRG